MSSASEVQRLSALAILVCAVLEPTPALASDEDFSAPYLGPAEDFAGEGLASPARALFATTRGVLLCDRTRELFLLDYATLRTLRGPAAELTTRDGSLAAHGEWVCVLGATTLSILRVER